MPAPVMRIVPPSTVTLALSQLAELPESVIVFSDPAETVAAAVVWTASAVPSVFCAEQPPSISALAINDMKRILPSKYFSF